MRYCGRLFACLGADVVRIDHGDDTGIGHAGEAGRAYGRWLDDRKRRSPTVDSRFDLVPLIDDARTVTAADSVGSGRWWRG